MRTSALPFSAVYKYKHPSSISSVCRSQQAQQRAQLQELHFAAAQDIPDVSGRDDVALLEWATRHGRVLLTHDLSTMIPAMREQLRRASACTPIVLVPDYLPVGTAIEQILLLEFCAAGPDWSAGVVYLPL